MQPGLAPRDHALVIGEAVRLELRPASFPARLGAYGIDLAVRVVVVVLLWDPLGAAVELLDGAAAQALVLVLVVSVLVGLPALVETVTRGRSVGKVALGLRVVRDDGGPVRARHALIRALVGVGELWFFFGVVAFVAVVANPRHKRLGDMLAGTYLIKERVRARRAEPVAMPPELAGWASRADLHRLPDDLALQIRWFLGDADRQRDDARNRIATALAARAAALVAPRPPPGTPAERFLAAVLAERRTRELARLRRQQDAELARHAVLHRLPHGMRESGSGERT